MTKAVQYSEKDSFSIPGKLALPYQYYAGEVSSRFLLALREGKIFGARCPECNKVYVPPRAVCERHIQQKLDEWVELPGPGTVKQFTVIRYQEPYLPFPPPYVLALIQLDGADSALAHVVRGVAPSEMRVGLRVRPVFRKKPEGTLGDIECFKPEAESGYKLGFSYEELEPGMSATFTKTISETDVYLFAGISGDFNPMHVDEEFAKKTPFGKRIAHGALPYCLIAPVLGMKLPGLGTVALEMQVRFRAPTYFGDTITARATVAEKRDDRKWVRMECEWTNQDGKIVATGSVLVQPPPKM